MVAMAKRLLNDSAETAHGIKKQKRTAGEPPTPVQKKSEAPDIQSADQLRQLLNHKSDDLLRVGLQSFKHFLDVFRDGGGGDREKQILQDYLESQSPKNEGEIFLSNVMEAWGKASQSNNLSLQSQIPAFLASLLKALSLFLEFRTDGLSLCTAVLEGAQLRVVARGLASNRDFVVNPCLRLLTEIVSFDGGSHGKALYAQRELTFKRLGHNLGIKSDAKSPKHRPSIRNSALSFLLANFQHQDAVVKEDLSQQTDVISALFKHIENDSPFWISRILKSIKTDFIEDTMVQRNVKGRLLSSWVLTKVAGLYGYKSELLDESEKPQDVAHSFLLEICCKPNIGLLTPDTNWYPPGLKTEAVLDGLATSPSPISISVRNKTLATFVQNLKPWAGTKQCDLLLAIFRAAPELVAHYFTSSSFPFEPGQTSTWMGCSMVLYSAVQLPVPLLESSVPPPIAISLQNVLPEPATEVVLLKSLRSKAELVAFFVMRLLTASFEKLELVRKAFYEASWNEAYDQLRQAFIERIPSFKEIVTVFRTISDGEIMQKEAACRLMRLYFDTIPGLPFSSKLDLSQTLSLTAEKALVTSEDEEVDRLRLSALEHLFAMATASPAMHWTGKVKGATYSPIVAIVRLIASGQAKVSSDNLLRQLRAPCQSLLLFQNETVIDPLEALVATLPSNSPEPRAEAALDFLDKTFSVFSQKSFGYQDDFTSMLLEISKEEGCNGTVEALPCSLAHFALADQWPFFVKSSLASTDKIGVTRWIKQFFISAIVIGENHKIILRLLDKMATAVTESNLQQELTLDSSTLKELKTHRCTVSVRSDIDMDTDGSSPRELKLPFIPAKLMPQIINNERILFSASVALETLRSAVAKPANATALASSATLVLENIGKHLATTEEPSLRSALKKLICQGRLVNIPEEHLWNGNSGATMIQIQVWQTITSLLEILYSDLADLHLLHPYLDDLLLLMQSAQSNEQPSIETVLRLVQSVIPFCNEVYEERFISALPFRDSASTVTFINHYLERKQPQTLSAGIWRKLSILEIPAANENVKARQFAARLEELLSPDMGISQIWNKADLTAVTNKVANGNSPVQILSAPFKGLPTDTLETCQLMFNTIVSLSAVNTEAALELLASLIDKITIVDEFQRPHLPDSQVLLLPLLQSTFKHLESSALGRSLKRNSILANSKLLSRAFYLDIGSNELKKKILSKLQEKFDHRLFSPDVLYLCNSLVEPGRDDEFLQNWYLTVFPFLTRRFTSDEGPSDDETVFISAITTIFRSGEVFVPSMLDRLVPKTVLDPLIASGLHCRFRTVENYALMAQILSGINISRLEHGKFMGEALHNPMNALQAESSESDRAVNAFIIQQLFCASPGYHSNVSTIQRLLSLYRGTLSVADRLILNIFKHFSSGSGKSCYDLVSTVSFSNLDEPFIRLTNGKINISVSSEKISDFWLLPPLELVDISAVSMNELVCSDNPNAYDPEFLVPLIIYCLNSETLSIDVATIIDKNIVSLMLFMLSTDLHHLANVALQYLSEKLKSSKYSEASQVQLLIQEAIETAKTADGRLPAVLAAFAAKAAQSLINPLHCLYGKINHFLNQGPTWDLDKIPLLRKIFASKPDDDNAYYKEIEWMVNVLIWGLRQPQDVTFLQRSGAFELLLSHFGSPYLNPRLQEKMLHVLAAACRTPEGCGILSERLGISSWLYQHRNVQLESSQTMISFLSEKIKKSFCEPGSTKPSHIYLAHLVQKFHM